MCAGNALHEAVKAGQEAAARLLLDNGVDIDARGPNCRETALKTASRQNWEGRLISLLLEKGARVGMPKASDLFFLTRGARGAVPEASERGSALKAACRLGDLYAANLLLERGAVVDFAVSPPFLGPKMESLLTRQRPELGPLLAAKPPEPRPWKLPPKLAALSRQRQEEMLERLHPYLWRPRAPRDLLADWVWLESPPLRDCGCYLCVVDNERRIPSASYRLYSKSPSDIPTVTDPVSITLEQMGKPELKTLPEQMTMKLYNGRKPRSRGQLKNVMYSQMRADALLECHLPRPRRGLPLRLTPVDRLPGPQKEDEPDLWSGMDALSLLESRQ